MSGERPFRKETGLRHFFFAALYSWQGLRRLIKEAAFRHQLGAFVFGLIVLIAVGVSIERLVGYLILMLIMFAVEGLNTAIEEIMDRISPEYSDAARNAKDLGSFAAACLIGANAIYFAYILIF